MKRYIFLLIFFLFMGCAPEYMVKNIYIPPVGVDAKKCINRCEIARRDCQNSCDFEYNKCLNDAYKRAKDIKALEDIEYQKRYNRYKIAQNHYRLKLSKWHSRYDSYYKDYCYFSSRCRNSKDSYACDRQRDLRSVLDRLLSTKPVHPKMPYQKSFEQIYNNEKSICKNRCSCQKDYDICFLNCGGTIQMKKICIKNCDK